MTREETAKRFKKWAQQIIGNHGSDEDVQMFENILALLEQEPCDDVINRKDLEECKELMTDINGDTVYAVRMSDIRRLPQVTPQPKMGRWITKIKSDLRGDMWPTNPKCSECGGEPYYSNTIYNYKFCPYCGAKMEVEENG